MFPGPRPVALPDHASDADLMTGAALHLAHQGGWDELLVVLLPIGAFAGLLALANRRADRVKAERESSEPSDHE